MYSPKVFLPKGVKCAFVINRQLGSFSLIDQLIDVTDDEANEEDLADKILYFIPSDMKLVDQIKFTNIAEATIDFTSSFDESATMKVADSENCA